MINWTGVATTTIWLLGLALLVAGLSLAVYARAGMLGLPLRELRLWSTVSLTLGLLVFAVGMLLTAQTPLEAIAWAVVSSAAFVGGWTQFRRTSADLTAAKLAAAAAATDRGAPDKLVVRVAQWIIRLELLWLLLLAPPLLFAPRVSAPLLLLLPVLWIARKVALGRLVPPTLLDLPVLLLLLMVLVSLFATYDLAVSLPKISGMLLGIALFYALVDWAGTRARVTRLAAAFAMCGALVAIIGLVGARWLDKFAFLTPVTALLPRFRSDLLGGTEGIHPNEIAGTLLLFVPLDLTLLAFFWPLLAASQQWRVVGRFTLLLLVALTTVTLLLAQSRSALVGFAVALVALLLAHARRYRVLIVGLALALGVLLPANIASMMFDGVGTGGILLPNLSRPEVRLEIWARAISAISDFPLTGAGMNTFRHLMPTFYPVFALPVDYDIAHAHNQLLQVAVDLGLPGLVAYLSVWIIAAMMLLLTWRYARDRFSRFAVSGVGAGLLGFFVFGGADAVALGARPGILFWSLLALLVVLYRGGFADGQRASA